MVHIRLKKYGLQKHPGVGGGGRGLVQVGPRSRGVVSVILK